MANPYHDETGRFCSRGEMLGAVHKLASTGKVSEYLRLKSEFDEADKGNVTVSRDVLDTLIEKSAIRNVEIPEDNEALEALDNYPARLQEFRALETYQLAAFGSRENDPDFLHAAIADRPERASELIKGIANNFNLSYEEKMDFVEKYDPSAISEVVRHEGDTMFRYHPEHTALVKQRMSELAKKPVLTEAEDNESQILAFAALQYVRSSEDLEFIVDNTSYEGHPYDTISVAAIQNPYLTSPIAKKILEAELNVAEGDYRTTRFFLEGTLKEHGHTIPKYDGSPNAVPLKGTISEAENKLKQNYYARAEKASSPFFEKKNENYAQVFSDTYEENYNKLADKLKSRPIDFNAPEFTEAHDRYMLARTRLNNLKDYEFLKEVLDTDPLKD